MIQQNCSLNSNIGLGLGTTITKGVEMQSNRHV